MNRDEKGQIIERVNKALTDDAAMAVVCHYRGLTVGEMSELRANMRPTGATMRVVKNTLVRRALEGTDFTELSQFLSGPTILTIASDPVGPAKVLTEFAKNHPNLVPLGGVLEGDVIKPEELEQLAKLPSREVLVAKVLGSMQAPISNLVGTLAALNGGLVRVLDQVRQQKEGAEG